MEDCKTRQRPQDERSQCVPGVHSRPLEEAGVVRCGSGEVIPCASKGDAKAGRTC